MLFQFHLADTQSIHKNQCSFIFGEFVLSYFTFQETALPTERKFINAKGEDKWE